MRKKFNFLLKFLFVFLFFAKESQIRASEFEEPVDNLEKVDFDPINDEEIDLAQYIAHFVLETKEIKIPYYEYAFNPSVTRWQNKILMSFRIRDPKNIYLTNQIGLVWLDENFDLISKAYVLNIPHRADTLSKQQDPRLITVEDRLYIVYSNFLIINQESEIARRMFIAEVHFDGSHFFTDPPICLKTFERQKVMRWEKNWVPFVYENTLLLAYSLNPHRIMQVMEKESCKTYALSNKKIEWKWGELRGGTPAILDDDQYLALFHSSIKMKSVQSNGKIMPHYFMGAYTFSSTPPFEIKKISPFPIIGHDFYTSPSYKTWKPLKVIFPGGMLLDDSYVWVVFGKQDFEIWIAKLDKKELINYLIPVDR